MATMREQNNTNDYILAEANKTSNKTSKGQSRYLHLNEPLEGRQLASAAGCGLGMPVPQGPHQHDIVQDVPVPCRQGSRWDPRKTQLRQLHIELGPGNGVRRAARARALKVRALFLLGWQLILRF